jgi:hypothetical protein
VPPKAWTMIEQTVDVHRVMSADDANAVLGKQVGTELAPTFASPADGRYVRLIEDGETVGLITRLRPADRVRLRHLVTGYTYGDGVARQGRGNMSFVGVTFGYAPRRVMARQEGCRMTAFGRDDADGERFLEDLARELTDEFAELVPNQAAHDVEVLGSSVLTDWRMGETSLWTSGVINKANVLPYHRDGNNLNTWSAMPTIRYGMDGGRLHVPEYDLVFPCGDGDVTWFYGRGLVHGVTPMRERKPGAYRYSLVFYALKGMTSCTEYAAETARAHVRRTARERAEADSTRISAVEPQALVDLVEFAKIEKDAGDIEPWAELIRELHRAGHLDGEEALWLVALYNTYDDLASAWQVFRRWPSPQAWAEAPDRDEAASYPCTQERRGLRGGKVLQRHDSYVDQLAGLPQATWLKVPLTGRPGPDYRALMKHMRSVWGVGRQSAFEWAEFVEKVADWPVAAPDAELWESEGPRRALQRLYGNPAPTLGWLNAHAEKCRELLTEAGVELSWEDFETVICDFNVMRDGRYFPGRHLAALREEIETVGGDDSKLLLEAFKKITPHSDIAPGIDKSKLPIYRDTGRMVSLP